MNRNGIMAVVDDKGREKERYPVVYGARVLVEDGAPVKSNQILLEWDPYTFSILTEVSGVVHFKDLIDGVTMQEQVDEVTGMSQLVVIGFARREAAADDRSPARRRHAARSTKKYLMPTHAHLMVRDGDEVHAGDVLAKIPRETTKTKDITGGLPRVVELFEARKPRETAIIAEINGIVKYGEVTKGQRKIYVIGDDGEQREYSLPRGVHINVQEGERVKAGEPLMDGPRNPHDILAVLGEKELQKYLVNEIQEVYRLQGVNINDKHLEVISRQMMRWVKVEDIGDTEFLPEEVVDKFKFRAENDRVIEAGGRPAQGKADAARHHQGVALDRFVHLGGVLPGDHARAHRSRHQRQGGLPARPEGERHHGPPGPGRHRHGVLPPGEDRRRGRGGRDAVVEAVRSNAIPGYDEEARMQYAGGLPEDTGEERWPSKSGFSLPRSFSSAQFNRKGRGNHPGLFHQRRSHTNRQFAGPATPVKNIQAAKENRPPNHTATEQHAPIARIPRMIMRNTLALIAVSLLLPGARAAEGPEHEQLFRTLAALDAALFDTYNKCDLEKNRSFFADDLEFYHDQGGLTIGADTLIEQLKKNICGKTRRELVPGSLEVHQLKGFGAVQMGVHRFFSPIDATEPVGEAKFIHIWRYTDGAWKITRVISYDHGAVKK